jgi:hypothetical protein
MAVVWKDKRVVHMLTNIHNPPAEGNFCDEKGNAIKPLVVEDYDRHMGYVDKGDRMANSYLISCCTWKWTKKLFFHMLDLAVLNSYILLFSCGGKKITHREFQLALVLVNSHMYRDHQVGQQMLINSVDWTLLAAISTGLFHLIGRGVACVQLAGKQEK